MNDKSFFAIMLRQRYIRRWGLMRSTRDESLTEHTADVAMLAHALAVIGNEKFGKHRDADRAVTLALFHDVTEVYTGDLPTPVKYSTPELRENYRFLEQGAADRLLSHLPSFLREDYRVLLLPDREDAETAELMKLVKAADKLSALIKCIEERNAGNREFLGAEKSTRASVEKMDCEELRWFIDNLLPAFELTLDETEETEDDGENAGE